MTLGTVLRLVRSAADVTRVACHRTASAAPSIGAASDSRFRTAVYGARPAPEFRSS